MARLERNRTWFELHTTSRTLKIIADEQKMYILNSDNISSVVFI